MRARAAAIVLGLAACLAFGQGCGRRCGQQSPAPAVTIAGRTWRVELAITSQQRAAGLSGRRSLAEDRGMLFIFDRARVLEFWMQGCHIPLDIAFIGPDMKVVSVQTMYTEPDLAGRRTYSSGAPAQYALEAPAGSILRAGVRPGDEAAFSADIWQAVKAGRDP